METFVPLISSTVPGPLGVVHLPRMWIKAILAEVGVLEEGWFPGYRGFNKAVLDALGIDQAAFFAFAATIPSYPQTERWVAANAARLDPASIAAANETVLIWERPEDAAAALRERVGLHDSTLRLSAQLNDLDDWDTVHRWIVGHRGAQLAPVIPLVSSGSAGPLGAKHLPRLWIKASLKAIGALPPDYNSGCGFDGFAAELLGLDLDATVAYIHAELPAYVAFERWVSERTSLDAAALAAYNATIAGRMKPVEKAAAERAESGVPELSFREVILCNDMLDWHAMHCEALARRSAVPAG